MSVQVMVYRIISALGVYNTRMAGFLLYIGTDIIAIYIFYAAALDYFRIAG